MTKMRFKELPDDKVKEFCEWARANYKPFTAINGMWHPVVQTECVKINIEHTEFTND